MSNEMSRMKFYCDDHRCIECFACSVACAEAHELPTGISRRKVITLFDGIEGKEVLNLDSMYALYGRSV